MVENADVVLVTLKLMQFSLILISLLKDNPLNQSQHNKPEVSETIVLFSQLYIFVLGTTYF